MVFFLLLFTQSIKFFCDASISCFSVKSVDHGVKSFVFFDTVLFSTLVSTKDLLLQTRPFDDLTQVNFLFFTICVCLYELHFLFSCGNENVV